VQGVNDVPHPAGIETAASLIDGLSFLLIAAVCALLFWAWKLARGLDHSARPTPRLQVIKGGRKHDALREPRRPRTARRRSGGS
jgi:hypothetical protein